MNIYYITLSVGYTFVYCLKILFLNNTQILNHPKITHKILYHPTAKTTTASVCTYNSSVTAKVRQCHCQGSEISYGGGRWTGGRRQSCWGNIFVNNIPLCVIS